MLSVVFLLDKTNDWIESYVSNFVVNYKGDKCNLDISFNHEDVKDNDVVFILGYTRILNDLFLNSNKLNLVIHESDLPKGKGFSPVQWQILNGQNEIVFTLFEATKEFDSGDIFLQKSIFFTGYELFDEIREIQARKTLELIGEFLEKYPEHDRKKQKGKETVFLRRKYNNDELDINKTIKEQFNHLRIANNNEHPLWFKIDGHEYTIKVSKGYHDK
jgi:methionyl-tRNA formyltransferase